MEEIDDLIRKMAENWDFDRIAKIDLTLLRLGIHELLHRPDVPPVVVINEIIELGKVVVQIFSHAHGLSALAGKYECN